MAAFAGRIHPTDQCRSLARTCSNVSIVQSCHQPIINGTHRFGLTGTTSSRVSIVSIRYRTNNGADCIRPIPTAAPIPQMNNYKPSKSVDKYLNQSVTAVSLTQC